MPEDDDDRPSCTCGWGNDCPRCGGCIDCEACICEPEPDLSEGPDEWWKGETDAS